MRKPVAGAGECDRAGELQARVVALAQGGPHFPDHPRGVADQRMLGPQACGAQCFDLQQQPQRGLMAAGLVQHHALVEQHALIQLRFRILAKHRKRAVEMPQRAFGVAQFPGDDPQAGIVARHVLVLPAQARDQPLVAGAEGVAGLAEPAQVDVDRSQLAACVHGGRMLVPVQVQRQGQSVVTVAFGQRQLPCAALDVAQAPVQVDRDGMAVADAGLQLRQRIAETFQRGFRAPFVAFEIGQIAQVFDHAGDVFQGVAADLQ